MYVHKVHLYAYAYVWIRQVHRYPLEYMDEDIRDGIVVYLERHRYYFRTGRSCPCNFYRSDYDDTFRAKFIAAADDGCISIVGRGARYEWPFQVPSDVFR